MHSAEVSDFWLDVTNDEQAVWALNYLRKKNVTYNGRDIVRPWELRHWLKKETEAHPDSGVLIRMERAWDQVKRRNEARMGKMQRLNTLISGASMRKLVALRKEYKTTNANVLDLLLSHEHEQASEQKQKTKDALEKLEKSKARLRLISNTLDTCLSELSKCIVIMEDAGLSLSELTEEQQRRSAQLCKERLNELTGSDMRISLDVLLFPLMERPDAD